jgi:hypothetical protein
MVIFPFLLSYPTRTKREGRREKERIEGEKRKRRGGWVLLPNQLMREREGRETKLEREEERGVSSDGDGQQWRFRQTRNSNSASLHA